MKLLALVLPLVEIISLTPSGEIEPIKLLTGFKSIECSPITSSKGYVSFSSSFITKIKSRRRYKAILYVGDSGYYKNIFDFESSENDLTKDFLYQPGLNGSGKIFFTITSSSGSTLDAVTINVPFSNSTELSIFESGEYYANSKFACYTPEKGQFEKSEQYSFVGINKYITANQNPYIDFSTFRLKYTAEVEYFKELTYEYCGISIYNPDGIFNEVADEYGETITSTAVFRLTLNKDPLTNEYYLSPVSTWYVDKQTSKMYKTNNDNCVKTNKIHIPTKYFDIISTRFCMIYAHGTGFCHTSISGNFSFSEGGQTFGSCENSDYCVKEGSGESDYELGEVYEH